MSECPDCSCSDFDKCMRILNLMLDDEADEVQEEYFFNHIEKCIVCFSHYNVEKQIRELLKRKLQKRKVPAELAIDIRNKIVQ